MTDSSVVCLPPSPPSCCLSRRVSASGWNHSSPLPPCRQAPLWRRKEGRSSPRRCRSWRRRTALWRWQEVSYRIWDDHDEDGCWHLFLLDFLTFERLSHTLSHVSAFLHIPCLVPVYKTTTEFLYDFMIVTPLLYLCELKLKDTFETVLNPASYVISYIFFDRSVLIWPF